MKPNHGAQFQISIDGVPRTYRDRKEDASDRPQLRLLQETVDYSIFCGELCIAAAHQ
jgi:hypothetical protein